MRLMHCEHEGNHYWKFVDAEGNCRFITTKFQLIGALGEMLADELGVPVTQSGPYLFVSHLCGSKRYSMQSKSLTNSEDGYIGCHSVPWLSVLSEFNRIRMDYVATNNNLVWDELVSSERNECHEF
jgi:hypothetical protein